MIESIGLIATFVRIAETRSFSSAAHQLGLSGPAVSKALARLERRLGARLLNRTTRKVSLTDDGQVFLERCRQILSDVQDAEELLTSRRISPRGRLRVQMPVGFGRRVIVPALPQLLGRYPDLAIDIELSDRIVDLAEEGLDVAIRIGALADARAIARELYRIRFVTCAAPEYLARNGTPQTPEDLAGHACLPYWMPKAGRYREWHFERAGVPFSLPVNGRLNINNSEALIDAAIEGSGIVSVATFLAVDAVRAGTLKVLLRDYITAGPAVSVVHLPNRNLSARLRAFLDFLAALIPPVAPWDAAVIAEARPPQGKARRGGASPRA